MRIATKWSEVTLKQYITIADITAIDMDELDKQVKILSVLSNTPEEVLCQLSLSDLKEAIRHCQFIYTKPLAGHIKQYIRIGRHKFKVNTNLKKITAAEYIDLTGMIKDKDEVTQNLPKVISIFLHPVNWFGFKNKSCYENKVQTIESRNKTAEIIEEKLMMSDVMMLSGFFLRSWQRLTKATIDYSESQTAKARKMLLKVMEEDSKIIGDGI